MVRQVGVWIVAAMAAWIGMDDGRVQMRDVVQQGVPSALRDVMRLADAPRLVDDDLSLRVETVTDPADLHGADDGYDMGDAAGGGFHSFLSR